VVKVDVDGGEWTALQQLIESGLIREGKIEQLIVEVSEGRRSRMPLCITMYVIIGPRVGRL
jgi:hypothetical protein